MKIGFDAKRALYNRSGLGNYSRNVISDLYFSHPENEYYLCSPKLDVSNPFYKKYPQNWIRPQNSFWRLFSSLWRHFGVAKQLNASSVMLFHGVSNEIPAKLKKYKISSVVTIHDLIFLRYPHYYSFFSRLIYNYKSRKACENADLVVAISEQTKSDIVHFYGISPQKIQVVYQGCNRQFTQKVDEETRKKVVEKYQLPSDFVLYVGTVEDRKNLLNLVKAMHVANLDRPLVVVGRHRKYAQLVKNYIDEHHLTFVHFLENGDFNDFPSIYQSAYCMANLSYFEGFGAPLIEAMYSGIPSVLSHCSCFPEIAGDAALYVNPDHIEEIGNALKSIFSDSEVRKKLIENCEKRKHLFSYEQMSHDLNNCYKILYPNSFITKSTNHQINN